MADIRKIVSIDYQGTVTTLLDLEVADTYTSVRGSFQIQAAPRNQIVARNQRRYAGGRVVDEQHDNAIAVWKMLAAGASADAALDNIEAALSVLDRARVNLYLEWRPDGATASSYREIRGPATVSTEYEWAQFAGARSLYVNISIPVAPLAIGARSSATVTSASASIFTGATGLTVPGHAPALGEIEVRTAGGAAAAVWAMLAWWKTPSAPLASSFAPLGVLQNTDGTPAVDFSTVADAVYSGGSGAEASAISSVVPSTVTWKLDPSTVEPDDFTLGTIDVEIWARVQLTAGNAPKLTVSLSPDAGADFGPVRYTIEHGQAGKVLTVPSAGSVRRFVRLGTITMPVFTDTPAKYALTITAIGNGGNTGKFGIDYIALVPSRARACSRTGQAADATYPKFFASTNNIYKRVLSDLRALTKPAAGAVWHPDNGLGGAPIEFPVGALTWLCKVSSLVPDNPAVNTDTEQLNYAIEGVVTAIPRYRHTKGT